jgi:hypothetical protein
MTIKNSLEFLEPESWFEQEYCDRHNPPVEADLVGRSLYVDYRFAENTSDWPDVPPRTYRWRCPKCRIGWVTEGSPMEAFNTLVYAAADRANPNERKN